MNELIRQIYGNGVTEEEYRFPKGTPYFISGGYDAKQIAFANNKCLLVRPTTLEWDLASIKKQIRAIENISGLRAVVSLDRLTAKQRENLVRSGIGFVAGTNQLFIPFWGSYFEQKLPERVVEPDKLTSNAQLVFLYLYYLNNDGSGISQTQIAGALGLSKATCTRAIRQLLGLKLVSAENKGVSNLISLKGRRAEALKTAMGFFSPPVRRKIYVNALPDELRYKYSGMIALSKTSHLSRLPSDGAYAVSRDEAGKLGPDLVVDEQDYRDFGGFIIEEWKYDPFLLSDTNIVDDISLLLELDHETDERVQKELDDIRGKHGLVKGE